MGTIADLIVKLERDALDRWGRGDPGGFLDVYADGVTYFDPGTAARIDGRDAMTEYYRPWSGQIAIDRYDMLNPAVVVEGNMAVLSYNLVNYHRDLVGQEAVGSRWNSTAVYQCQSGSWKLVHTHWSFTAHPALQNPTPVTSERA